MQIVMTLFSLYRQVFAIVRSRLTDLGLLVFICWIYTGCQPPYKQSQFLKQVDLRKLLSGTKSDSALDDFTSSHVNRSSFSMKAGAARIKESGVSEVTPLADVLATCTNAINSSGAVIIGGGGTHGMSDYYILYEANNASGVIKLRSAVISSGLRQVFIDVFECRKR